MKDIDRQNHKLENNVLYYWNGKDWLVRETFKSKKEAQDFMKQRKIKYGK